MGENSSASASNDEYELKEIRNLLWGSIKEDVFRRWSQGFEFSDVEPSALVQKQGGPCAVIAPVQAFLLKILLMETPGHNLKDLTNEKCNRLLIQALCNILMKCKVNKYRIVYLPDISTEAKESSSAPSPAADAEGNIHNSVESNEEHIEQMVAKERPEWTSDEFHDRLSVIHLETIDDVEKYYTDNFYVLTGKYGVLLFMYSVILTKGVENVQTELSDTSEPLIHNTYGYGSQGLINLMLTGRAVSYVWDNDQDVGGLKLRGINQQSDIGFITLMEQMRYCTVGSFYKNPKNPVWIMGSDTHLTVLFSNEKRLVSPETPSEIARRVFKSYDPDCNNFIPTPVLQDVLCTLHLVSDPEYVAIMQKKLDPENLGIILLNAFMDEFFPEDQRSMPDTFDLMHYNGIPGSNFGNKVKYNKGTAILLESDLKLMCSISNNMLTCLQTKWPNIEVNWNESRIPSLN
ncbi:ubiquitin carboxyl-terminal hydrolase MINDY-3 homolog [Condylostylus longicornis]|uniref:ubiquitin carboxyl-terminal hydrolase MINDY-3 homolog n=1 Tax=Condylostylus longicornis TaxID=2530218 RepID=UPI00244DEB90|nr:ubiquitin carboxyl-terminal hydrolase MINDY-3 homolog [Condylostylus longicornis]XP_055371104.1 ubiquitin carboxyl-terminal hydrolase MINDY-3 homolog [Condylostylus longicornis]XP_055371105.1 ubiquitin carboxyl-terminal hydrolase MINDY-3 homolog [Condylostylus longicornis]